MPALLRPTVIAAVFAAAWGLAVLAGGSLRFEGYGIGGADSWWAWGIAMTTYAALLLLTERCRCHWVVFIMGGVPYAFITISMLTNVSVNPTAPMTGAILYFVIWTLHVVVGARIEVGKSCKRGLLKKMIEKDRQRLEKI